MEESLAIARLKRGDLAGCWDNYVYDPHCESNQFLIWFEAGQEYAIESFLPNATAKDALTAIAESMK